MGNKLRRLDRPQTDGRPLDIGFKTKQSPETLTAADTNMSRMALLTTTDVGYRTEHFMYMH